MNWQTVGLALVLLSLPYEGFAHALNPGVLRMVEKPDGVSYHWQPPSPSSSDPVPGEAKLKDSGPLFSPKCTTKVLPAIPGESRGYVSCPPSVEVEGSIVGLEEFPAEVILLWRGVDSNVQWVLRDEPRSFTLSPSNEEAAGDGFYGLGVIHIVEGVDHLLFCAGFLLLLFPAIRTSIIALSAFTVGHALSMGFVFGTGGTLSSVFVENCISLSLVALAIEVLRKRNGLEPGITERYPWGLGLLFGCIHGMGFAGAIAEIGVPTDAILSTLLLFNLGVETGQIAFCLLFFGLARAMNHFKWDSAFHRIVGYTVGMTGVVLVIERGFG